MSTELELIAVGARTPLGNNAEASAAAARAGVARIQEHPFVTARGEPIKAAPVQALAPALLGPERLLALARGALDEVAAKLAAAGPHQGPIDLLLALPEPRPGLSARDVSALARALSTALAPRPSVRSEVVGHGHAAVALAIERAAQASRPPDVLTLVLAVDSHIHPDTFLWLERERRLAPAARSGLVPGEAAGCLALAAPRLRRQLGLGCLARIGGVATAHETLLPGSETGSFGAGMTRAVLGATARLELPRDAVDAVYLDLNGERYRSEEWGFVALRAPAAFRTLDYEAPADLWGDVGAATGALAAVLAAQAWARGYARGPRALTLAGSSDGLRGAVLLQTPGSRDDREKLP